MREVWRRLDFQGLHSELTVRRRLRQAKHVETELLASCHLCESPLTSSTSHLHQWTCPQVQIPCVHAGRGCPTIMPRAELDCHLVSCPFEALGDFFLSNDARFVALEEKQNQLQGENELLRAELRHFRLNVSVARQSLGSMWRQAVDEPRWGASPDNSSADLDVEDQSGQPEPAGGLPTASLALSHNAQVPSAYSRHRGLSPSVERQRYADWAFGRLSSSQTISLDGVVAGLRSVVLHLAAGLDTMERRNEV